MGVSTVTAARRYLSEMKNTPILETKLSWETMPNLGLSKVSTTHLFSKPEKLTLNML